MASASKESAEPELEDKELGGGDPLDGLLQGPFRGCTCRRALKGLEGGSQTKDQGKC